MADQKDEKPETTKVTFIRGVQYKGVDFKAGATAELEPAVAERLIAEGHATVTEEKKSKKSE